MPIDNAVVVVIGRRERWRADGVGSVGFWRWEVLQAAPTGASLVLIADIGGSTSRFGLAVDGQRPQQVVVVSNATVSTLEAAITQYLARVGARPTEAIFAVAGPINGDDVALTNRSWRFNVPEMAALFGFRRLRVVNDFEALAWALPGLTAADIRLIGRGPEPGHGVKVVLGPGTGLGVAALVPVAGAWRVIASEGGHVSFGPGPRTEQPVFDRLWDQYGPVSAEMVLSGAGLHRLYRAVNSGAELPDPETIVAMAKAGDPAACAAAGLFVRLLGRFAGDIALTFKATGGVYIAGGVAAALSSTLDDDEFRAAFESHPPHQALLAAIPTCLITSPEPGLIGCATMAAQSNDGPGIAASAR